MAWSSNRFCDFGAALNPPLPGQQAVRNRGAAPKFNPTAVSTGNSNNSIYKLESLKAGTTAVSNFVTIYPFNPF